MRIADEAGVVMKNQRGEEKVNLPAAGRYPASFSPKQVDLSLTIELLRCCRSIHIGYSVSNFLLQKETEVIMKTGVC